MNETTPSFEEALARLERIVQELEGKELTLEETLARYEEGCRLVRECTSRLEAAEQRLRVLSGSPPAPEERTEPEPATEESAEEGDSDGLPF